MLKCKIKHLSFFIFYFNPLTFAFAHFSPLTFKFIQLKALHPFLLYFVANFSIF